MEFKRIFLTRRQAYLVGVAQKWGLYKHIRFNSAVEEARWDDQTSKWKVAVKISGQKDSEFTNGYVISSDFLISAVGQLNIPRYPDIPGLEDFEGRVMHSARWDWSYDFKDKKIAVIGNGNFFFEIDSSPCLLESMRLTYGLIEFQPCRSDRGTDHSRNRAICIALDCFSADPQLGAASTGCTNLCIPTGPPDLCPASSLAQASIANGL